MLELRFLSRPHVLLDGEEATDFVSEKVLALLSYLALNEGPLSRDVLAGLLWGEMTDERARANLRVALHNLRQLLPDFLDVTRKTAALARDGPIWIDVIAFEEGATSSENSTALQKAVDLYDSEFLAGLNLYDEVEFQEWLTEERERLRLILLKALESLATQYLLEQEWQPATAAARRLVVVEPWREASHRQLMLLLARQEEYGLALAQYETCRRVLEEELGVPPMPETEALRHRIRRLRMSVRHNLSEFDAPLVGRDQELAQLRALLTRDEVRLISIIGMGGAGKTCLAQEVAWQQINAFLDGVFMVPLAELPSGDFLIPAIAQALGRNVTAEEKAQSPLLDFFQNRELLLVLDNYEHLLPDISLLRAILVSAPSVKIIVTSREPLQMRAETVFSLSGLELPPSLLPVEQWESSGSVAFFLSCVRQLLPSFSPSEQERRAITRLCELVEGLPLGLELAAGWIDVMPLTQIAGEIEENLGFLQQPSYDRPPRHNSIYSAFATSWQRLEVREQQVLSALSVFRNGFTHSAALSVANADTTLLTQLVRKSLVQYQRAEERYRLHELLRHFSSQKLATDPEALEEYRKRHVETFLALAEKCDEEYRRTKQPEWLDRLWVERDNLNAALRWTLAQGEIEIAGRIGSALGVFWGIRGYLHGGRQWLEAILEQQGQLSAYTLGKVFFAQGWLAFEQGDYPLAEGYYRSSFELLEERDAGPLKADLLGCLGHVAQQRANYKDAIAFSEQSLALYRRLNDKGGIALILNRLGRIAELQGDYDRAIKLLQEGLDLRQAIGDERGIASSLNGLAEIARYQKQSRQAAAWYEQALATCRRLGDKRCVAGVQHNLAHVALDLADASRAISLFQDSLLLYNELENREGVALCLAGLGRALGMQGERERAALLLSKAESLFSSQQLVLAAADRQAFEQALAAAYGESEDPSLDSAWSRGRTLPVEVAIQLALV